MADWIIRATTPDDAPALLALYPHIFPDEDLRPVVSALLATETGVLSLAAWAGRTPIGHVLFTRCSVAEDGARGALLGPLGVVPDRQRQGVGGALVRAGLERLDGEGVAQVFVLGDPAYYGRFGFTPERAVLTPCPIPDQWAPAWRSLTLSGRAPLSPGPLSPPAPWLDPNLWSP